MTDGSRESLGPVEHRYKKGRYEILLRTSGVQKMPPGPWHDDSDYGEPDGHGIRPHLKD